MPNFAENGSLAESRRALSQGWGWIYAPDGRMGRADFFYACLARAFAVALPVAVLTTFGVSVSVSVPIWTVAIVLTVGGPLARRLHDVGQSGLHAPWLCFSLVLAIVLNGQLPRPLAAETAIFYLLSWTPHLLVLALMFWPGAKGPNRYGPPPA